MCREGYTSYACDTRLAKSYRNESCSKCIESIKVTTASQVTDLQQTLRNTTIISKQCILFYINNIDRAAARFIQLILLEKNLTCN